MAKSNWFNTLNDALESENLVESWEINFSGIAYGQNFSYNFNDNGELRHVSIFRENDGRYERPVHYLTGYKIKE